MNVKINKDLLNFILSYNLIIDSFDKEKIQNIAKNVMNILTSTSEYEIKYSLKEILVEYKISYEDIHIFFNSYKCDYNNMTELFNINTKKNNYLNMSILDNIFSSPYIEDKFKEDFFAKIKKYNSIIGNKNIHLQKVLFFEKKIEDLFQKSLEDNKIDFNKTFDLNKDFISENDYSYVVFNIVYNKDIKLLNEIFDKKISEIIYLMKKIKEKTNENSYILDENSYILIQLFVKENIKFLQHFFKNEFSSIDNRYVNFVHFRNKNLLNDNFDITFLKKYIKLELELKLISSAFNLSDLSNIYKEIFITIVNNFDFLQTKETNILKEVLEEFDVEEFKNKHREILKTETKLDIDYIFDYSDTYKDIYIKIIEKIKNKIDIEETISLLSKIKKREVKEVNLMF